MIGISYEECKLQPAVTATTSLFSRINFYFFHDRDVKQSKTVAKIQSDLYPRRESSFLFSFSFSLIWELNNNQGENGCCIIEWFRASCLHDLHMQSKTKAECEFTLRFRAFTAIASLAMLFSLKSLSKSCERNKNNMTRRTRDCKVFYNFHGPKV